MKRPRSSRQRRLQRAVQRIGWYGTVAVLPAVFWLARPSQLAQAHVVPRLKPTPAKVQSVTAVNPEELPIPSRVTPESMSELQAQLQEAVAHAPARRAAVYVEDVGSGLTAAANPNRKFLAASLIKLPD